MPDTATPATEAETDNLPGDTVPAAETTPPNTGLDPVAEPDGKPQPQVVKFASHDLGAFMDTFGDAEGARMFRAGTTYEAAMIQHLTACKGQIQDLSAENSQLKANVASMAKAGMGETSPVNVGGETSRKSLSEAFRVSSPKR